MLQCRSEDPYVHPLDSSGGDNDWEEVSLQDGEGLLPSYSDGEEDDTFVSVASLISG